MSRADSIRAVVFAVLPEAWAAGTGNGALPISTRTLFYKVRPLFQQRCDRELKYSYFAYTLLPAYQRAREPLRGLYYDPRGELHEPHTSTVVQLGTREVASYQLPAWTFDKVLYVEKKGLWPVLQAARLAERYDLAVVVGEGYPVEAIRGLFARAQSNGGYRIFALHDADPYGYNIARVLAEETTRMPGYQVEVADLGLTVADAIRLRLPAEAFTRTSALPTGLDLAPVELEWFEGEQTGPRAWACQRVELNAFSSPDLIAYIETKLGEASATGKIVPPDDVLVYEARYRARVALRGWAEWWLSERFGIDRLADRIVNAFADQIVTDPAAWVTEAHEANRATWWKQAIEHAVQTRVDQREEALVSALERMLGNNEVQ